MAENRQFVPMSDFAEIDFCLRKYYNEHFSSVLSSTVKEVNQKKAEELHKVASETSPLIGAGSAFPGARDQYILQTAMRSEWGSKTTKDMMDMAASRMLDGKALQDMGVITDQWRSKLIERLGEAKYKQLSEKCGQDLATSVVLSRMNDLMKEQIARSKVPKSSFEYIMQKGFNESLIGTFAMLQSMPATSKEDFEIEAMTEQMYNPSGGEKVAGHAVGLLLDSPTLGAWGKWTGMAAKEGAKVAVPNAVKRSAGLVIDSGFRIAHEAGGPEKVFSSEELSEMAFGDKAYLSEVDKASRKINGSDSDAIAAINTSLSKPLRLPVSNGNISAMATDFAKVVHGSGSLAYDLTRSALAEKELTYLSQRKIPEWMKKMNEATCTKNAGYFLSVAMEMQAKGQSRIKLGSKEFTLKEVTQRAYDYSRAADWQHQKKGMTDEEVQTRQMVDKALGVRNLPDSPLMQNIRASLHKNGLAYIPEHGYPKFMESMSQADLEKSAKGWRNLAVKMQSEKKTEITVKGIGKMTLAEVTQRAYDYALCADGKFKDAREAKIAEQERKQAEQRGRQQTSTQRDPNLHNASLDISGGAGGPQQSMMHNAIITEQQGGQQPSQGQGGYQQQPLPQQMGYQPAQVLPNQQNVQGWGDMLENMGMGSLTRLGKGFGETLTVMPELMYGMFTGKIRNFRMEDNLLPLGLLMAGLFVSKRSHPILKLLLLALGGMLLLGNANDAVHGREKTQPQAKPTYRRYEEEALDPRIRDPHVIGNTLVAEVDGHHLVLTINEDQVLDAYGKGVIPLNNLCNAALRSYDEQGGVAARYEREMALTEKQEEERVRGLR